MKTLHGKPVVKGEAQGPALVTREPVNLSAAFTKPVNVLPGRRSRISDRHHDLFRKRIKGTILIFPAAIGSTYTGMMLLNLLARGEAPAGIIVQKADSLLTSGAILAHVWFDRGLPIVEYPGENLFELIHTGVHVKLDGHTGSIRLNG